MTKDDEIRKIILWYRQGLITETEAAYRFYYLNVKLEDAEKLIAEARKANKEER